MAERFSLNYSVPYNNLMEPDQDASWESIRWPDGALYEGLTRDGMLHRNGIFQYPNGDRYEGEFMSGRMDGHGVYIWRDGTMYRGEWRMGLMHGCGVRLWRGSGAPPGSGGASAGDPQGAAFQVQEGKFFADEFVGPVLSCSEESAREAAVEADVAARLSRAFTTPSGLSWRQQLAAASRAGKPPPKPEPATASGGAHASRAGTRPLPGSGRSQQQQEGWKWPWQGFRMPWDPQPAAPPSHSTQQLPHMHSSASPSSRQGTLRVLPSHASQPQPGRSAAASTQGPPMASDVSTEDIRGFLPSGHPGLDPDVRMRTRGLTAGEMKSMKGLLDVLMLGPPPGGKAAPTPPGG